MINRNLLDRLMPNGVDQSEFEDLIHRHFGSASGPADGDAVFLSAHNDLPLTASEGNYALKLSHNKEGALRAIEGGPAFTQDILNDLTKEVHDALIADHGTLIGAAILFSALPVNGSWRHGNLFQIFPVPNAAPRPHQPTAYHPFQIEFPIKNSPDWVIRSRRISRKKQEIGLLLNAFLEGHIIVRNSSARWHWVLLGDSPQWSKTVCAYEGYSFERFQPEKAEFSLLNESPALEAIAPGEFYSRFGYAGTDWKMHRPENLGELFDRFFALPVGDQKNFLTACFWFHHALRVSQDSESASYIALVQAIEALLPSGGSSNCTECGQPKYKLTEQFETFLKTYAANGGGIEQGRKRLYKIRSELSHGKRLLSGDSGVHWNWQDNLVWHELRQTVRITFVNWLMRQGNSK